MNADLAATRQASPAAIAYTLLRDRLRVDFALVTYFVLVDLQPCESLSPHHFEGTVDADLAATGQTNLVPIIYTLLGDCTILNFVLLTSFLVAHLEHANG